jgi:hypothetical protein
MPLTCPFAGTNETWGRESAPGRATKGHLGRAAARDLQAPRTRDDLDHRRNVLARDPGDAGGGGSEDRSPRFLRRDRGVSLAAHELQERFRVHVYGQLLARRQA